MKTYNGIELLQAIKEGELIKGQELKDEHGNIYRVTSFVGLLEDEQHNDIASVMELDDFIHTDFTLIEEEPDIDIQSIEEHQVMTTHGEEVNKINQIIKAIKQLDRQINNK